MLQVEFPKNAGRRIRHYAAYFQVSPADIIKAAITNTGANDFLLQIPKLTSGPQLQNVLIKMPVLTEISSIDSPRYGNTHLVPCRVLQSEYQKLKTISSSRLRTWFLAGIAMAVFHSQDQLAYSPVGISQYARVVHALLSLPPDDMLMPLTYADFSATGFRSELSGINSSLPYGWIPPTPEGPFDEPVCESVEITDATKDAVASWYGSVEERVIDATLHALENHRSPIFPGECTAFQVNIYAMKIPRAVMQWIGHVADRQELHRAQVLREFLYAGAGLWIATPDIAKQFAAEVKNATK